MQAEHVSVFFVCVLFCLHRVLHGSGLSSRPVGRTSIAAATGSTRDDIRSFLRDSSMIASYIIHTHLSYSMVRHSRSAVIPLSGFTVLSCS